MIDIVTAIEDSYLLFHFLNRKASKVINVNKVVKVKYLQSITVSKNFNFYSQS